MKRFLASLATSVLAMAGMAGIAHAQQVQTSPGVARVSLIRGSVSMQRADSGDWVAATINTPLLNGDTISTGPNSRAEVQLDFANVLRLGSNTTVKIATLDRKNIQVQVAQGLANFDVLYQDSAQAEVDTPNVAVHPLGNGGYRIEVPSSDQTKVSIRRGEADVSTPQGSTRVESGQLITIQGVDNPQYQTSNAGPEDSWDQWNRQRDRVIADASSWHHTDRYYTGAQDLDAYGRWIYVPNYGQVWSPYAYAGWAPYRDGRWVWEPFYGWTWVSYEPWGWAPYHYGRWFLYAGNWCWWPGPVAFYPAYYPIWAPAYVSFFGFGYSGVNFAFSFGFGNIGWLPIGPADPFYPWYGYRGATIYFRGLGRYHRDWDRHHGWGPLYRGRGGYSNFNRVLTDKRMRGGASWMRAKQFGRAPVPRQQRMIDGAQFRQARMFSGHVPVVPTRASLQTTNRAPNPASYRNTLVSERRFFMKHRPAPNPTPFREQRAQMERVVRESRKPNAGSFSNASRQAPAQRSFANRDGAPSRAMGQSGDRATQNRKGGFPSAGGSANGRPAPAPAQRASTPVHAARGNSQAASRAGWHSFGSASPAGRGNGSRAKQGRPSSNRGGGSAVPAKRGRPQSAPAQRQGGWRPFTPSSRQGQPAKRRGGSSGFTPAQRSSQPAQRQNWKTFTPKSEQPRNSPPARGQQSAPSQRQGGWRTFTPSSRPSSQGSGYRRSGRPPLNLRQPIVSPRERAPRQSSPSSNRPSSYRNYGGNRGSWSGGRAPAYRAPRGNNGGNRGSYRPRGGGSRGGSASRGSGSRGSSHRGGHHSGRPHH